ncbi:MAG: LAGLIDADG family homing endonuclease, partial [archaeon]
NVKTDLRLYGRIYRPLIQYLTFSTNPILHELTANPENCARFLNRLGLSLQAGEGRWRSYEELNPEEKKILSTGLLMHLHEYNTPEWKLNEMIGEVYTLLNEDPRSPLRDAKEYSTVLNACVIPGTEVYLNGKPTEIQNIESENVFSVEDGKIIRDKIVGKHEIPLPEGMNVFQIITQTGRKVSVTQNHELMTLSNGNVSWMASENLKEGDFIAISKSIPDVSKPLSFWDFFDKKEFTIKGNMVRVPMGRNFMRIPEFDRDLGFLLGNIAGDGSVKHTKIDICFNRKPRDTYSFGKINSYLQEKFGLNKPTITNHSNCYNAEWASTTLSMFIQRMGIPKGDKSKIVSFDSRILEAEKPFIAGILSGLFTTDGNISDGGVEFSSHSEKMINQTAYLLQRFRIIPHMIEKKCDDCDGLKYRIIICGRTNVQLFAREIGFPLQEINDFLINRTLKMNPINSRELYLPVREKLIQLWKWLGISTQWSSHFVYYRRGNQPSIENVRKYMVYYNQRVKELEIAVNKRNFKRLPNSLRFSKAKIAKECGISRAWLLRIENGKKPGKNAKKKIENGFIVYEKLIFEIKKKLEEVQQFIDSDIYWDTVKKIQLIEDKPAFVYDITVEKNHNYIANGIVVHNCGRNGQSTIGFHVCLGDRGDYYARAMGLLQEHRQNLAQGIQLMQSEGLEEYNHFYFFDAESRIKDSIVGIVAGMLYGSGSVKTDKPIVAFSRHEDGSIKVSARATSELVRNGVNLGAALKETCVALGKTAEGGGHRIAAGCRLEREQAKAFLEQFDIKLGEQTLSSHAMATLHK